MYPFSDLGNTISIWTVTGVFFSYGLGSRVSWASAAASSHAGLDLPDRCPTAIAVARTCSPVLFSGLRLLDLRH